MNLDSPEHTISQVIKEEVDDDEFRKVAGTQTTEIKNHFLRFTIS